jgi:hypothetical protein
MKFDEAIAGFLRLSRATAEAIGDTSRMSGDLRHDAYSEHGLKDSYRQEKTPRPYGTTEETDKDLSY